MKNPHPVVSVQFFFSVSPFAGKVHDSAQRAEHALFCNPVRENYLLIMAACFPKREIFLSD